MEKIDYKHGKFLILTTSTDGLTYEEYVDWCKDNGITPAENESQAFYDRQYGQMRDNYDSDMDNITSCSKYDVDVQITGDLDLWDGKHTIEPVGCSTVAEAIRKCIKNSDDCDVWFNDGAIEVEAKHHDGTNHFTIRAITSHGKEKRLPYLYAI